jgi:hypothetical protein
MKLAMMATCETIDQGAVRFTYSCKRIIGPIMRLIAQWSCSTKLFRY